MIQTHGSIRWTRARTTTVAVVGRLGPAWPVVAATAALFILSPVLVGGSLGKGALATMLPFASFLAIAAVGQTLVIQQGGLDFSIPGTMSLSAVVLTKYADQDSGRLLIAIAVVAVVAASIGLVNGIFVARLRVTPIVATLGVNALVLGTVRRVSGGLSIPPAPQPLRDFSLGTTIGIRNPLIVAVLVVVGVSAIVKSTVVGRRFEAVGSNPQAARLAGLNPTRHQIGAYVVASLSYAVAGVLIAGYLSTPGINVGGPYLLSSIAAVVIGGTSLAGGSGSVIAAGVGALFLTQLSQLLLGSGFEASINLVVQGGVIALSMAARTLVIRSGERRRRKAGLAAVGVSRGQTTPEAAVAAAHPAAPAGAIRERAR